ncbi:MAG: hypothetical protein HY823_10690 [Acidobacteria bacterium]|nr:hypothetical protein [Acidobacteriota bacterium]
MRSLPALAFAIVAPALLAQAPVLDSDALAGLRARNIGPAVMSGRIAALDGALEKGRVTIYVGAASGGVWKSANGGTTFKPVFDRHNQSIGAVRVDPADPKTLWVGTGECWVRNSVSVGDGLYKSTDGGDTWNRVGLADSERIAEVLVNPADSRQVFAAAMGRLWSSGGERGLYRTNDGGATWKRVLFVDENTGCSGLAMDPRNPKVLFAAMWDHRRTGWSFRSGGPGSGLFRSEDGGETWTRLTGDPKSGLPGGTLGRIVVAVAPSDPRIVYSVVEAQEGALFRSEDGGKTWAKRFQGPKILGRPFYFGAMTVDPKNPDRLYKMGFSMALSEDGGKTFAELGGRSTHGDHHALWIHPQNTEQLYLGEDGGFFTSEDRGAHWRYHRNLPLGQFYHVAVDDARPYRVFGGLQDNSSWMGFGSAWLGNRHWKNLYGGDGFWVQPDPTDANTAYAEYQGGQMVRVDLRSFTARSIKPQEAAGEPKFRFNWNTPLVLSPTQKGTLYTGAQYLFRTRDKGETWERLSPDLTTNDKAKQDQEASGGLTVDNSSAENHCTIYTIAESPRNGRLIWVGTDDGNLQLTRDAGKNWTNLASRVPGLPPHTWVSWVEASPHSEGTAFVTFDGHTQGDLGTRVYRTDDFGQTWRSLATPELKGFAHVIRQDPVRADLLYLGTESGLFISVDGGAHWAAFKGGDFPPVPVRDIAIHPREHDLVLGTHGRGIWIVDDLTPLRALTPEVLAKDLALLPVRPSQARDLGNDGWVDGDLEFTGEDRPEGAVFAFWQRKRHMIGEFKVEILDPSGKVVETMPGNKARGFNRMTWSRSLKAPRVATGATPSYAGFFGPLVLEGAYTLRLTKGAQTLEQKLILDPDPASPFSKADREARFAGSMALFGLLEDMAFTVERIRDLRDGARALVSKAADKALQERLGTFAQSLETERARFVPVKEVEGITGEERLREKVTELYGTISRQRERPSRTQLERLEALKRDYAEAQRSGENLLSKELAPLNEALAKAGLENLKPLARADWETRTARK